MKILLDTCVVVDLFQKREPFSPDSKKLFQLVAMNRVDGYLAATSISDFYYLMHKYNHSNSESREIVNKLIKLFNIADINANDIVNACNSSMSDFEDSIISEASARLGVDYIVTRNIKDFENSKIKAITPKDFINLLLN